MNFELIVMMLPADLTKKLSSNLHLIADSLAAKDVAGMQEAAGAAIKAVTDHVESLGITPEQMQAWLTTVGIDPSFLTIHSNDTRN